MSSDAFDAEYLLEQYELLRQEAIEVWSQSREGQGVLLFLTKGMVAWIEAVSCLSGRQAAPVKLADSPASISLQPDVTTVPANMVLGCMQEARA